jgi:Htaa
MSYGLRWAVKRSFLEYIGSLPDGRVVFSQETDAVDDELLFAPIHPDQMPKSKGDETRILAFTGQVRFVGHHGMLFVRIANPHLAITANEGVLTVEDPASESRGRIPLVTFSLGEASVDDREWTAIDVRLTPEGVPVFNEVYQANEPFEEFVVRFPATAS